MPNPKFLRIIKVLVLLLLMMIMMIVDGKQADELFRIIFITYYLRHYLQ